MSTTYLPGAAHVVLSSNVVHLDEASVVFKAMLAGWGLQQTSRMLSAGTIKGRLEIFQQYENPGISVRNESELMYENVRNIQCRAGICSFPLLLITVAVCHFVIGNVNSIRGIGEILHTGGVWSLR